MNSSLQLGPLTLPYSLLLLLAAVMIGSWLGERLARRAGREQALPLMRVLLAGLLAARLVFVWPLRDAYLQAPWSILDIRDGGLNAFAGMAGAWAYSLWAAWRRPWLRQPLMAGLAAASLIWTAGTFAPRLWPQAPAPTLPAWELPTPDGSLASLAGFAGKPVVLNLWASWCPPCRREMPVLQRMQAERPDIHFIFLNQGESAKTVSEYMAAQGLQLGNVLLDPQTQAGTYFGHRALPTTLFFDRHGRLAATRLGEVSYATLLQHLNALAAPDLPR